MGTEGFRRAALAPWYDVDARNAVIVEVGFQRARGPGEECSTEYLAGLGPEVHVIEVDPGRAAEARGLAGVTVHEGRAEDVLRSWKLPVGFAWLDGHDWPYAHAEAADPDVYREQRAEYRRRGQEYSRWASATSHLVIAQLLAPHVIQGGLLAFDDTWATPSVLDDSEGPGWNGKGCLAVPWLLGSGRGFTVVEEGDIHHGLVILRRGA